MVVTKKSHYHEWNESKNSTDENKVQAYNTKRYRGKKTRTKIQGPELKADNYFKGWCSDLEGFIFNLGPIASDKFSRTMKELVKYLGATYIDSRKPAIMTKTLVNFPDLEMTTIIPNTGIGRPKMDTDMIYLENKKIYKAIHKKTRNKDVYETDMYKIYNIIVGQKN